MSLDGTTPRTGAGSWLFAIDSVMRVNGLRVIESRSRRVVVEEIDIVAIHELPVAYLSGDLSTRKLNNTEMEVVAVSILFAVLGALVNDAPLTQSEVDQL